MRSFHLGHLAHGCSMGVPTWGALPARLKSILLLAMCGIYMRVLIIICNPGKRWPWSVPVKKGNYHTGNWRKVDWEWMANDTGGSWTLSRLSSLWMIYQHPCLHKIIRNLSAQVAPRPTSTERSGLSNRICQNPPHAYSLMKLEDEAWTGCWCDVHMQYCVAWVGWWRKHIRPIEINKLTFYAHSEPSQPSCKLHIWLYDCFSGWEIEELFGDWDEMAAAIYLVLHYIFTRLWKPLNCQWIRLPWYSSHFLVGSRVSSAFVLFVPGRCTVLLVSSLVWFI